MKTLIPIAACIILFTSCKKSEIEDVKPMNNDNTYTDLQSKKLAPTSGTADTQTSNTYLMNPDKTKSKNY